MKRIMLIAFIFIVLAQWIVPAEMIRNRRAVLQNGVAYKFRTQPIDPVDPFKGRYVALNFSENVCSVKEPAKYQYGAAVYVVFKNGGDGYAKIFSVSNQPPAGEVAFVKGTVRYITTESYDSSGIMHINYPFSEFYMEESKAPKTENLFRDSIMNPSLETYALVKVYKGDAVIEDLFFSDRSVKELLKEIELKERKRK